MAFSKELAEELTCPIDLEFYIEPMSLKCLHTLCKKDVDKMLNEDDLLLCPVCQNVSQKRDIKQDFKTQRLLDLHTANKDRLTTHLLCENCEDEIALTWCEQCHGYFGEKCGRGHMKFKTSKHHNMIKISTILEENKFMISSALQTINGVSDPINGLRGDCSDRVSKLDTTHKQGLDKIKASEQLLISVVRSSHDKLRQNLELDINQRQRAIEKIDSNLELIENKAENERKLLEDCVNRKDKKTMFDKEMIHDLTTQSRQKCEELTKELTQIKLPSQDISLSISNPDKIVQGIENIFVETKAYDSNTKQNDVLLQASAHPKIEISTKPEIAQCSLTSKSKGTNRIPTLNDYTKGKNKIQKLPTQLPEYGKLIRSIATINERLWLVMNDGSVQIMRMAENDTLSFQRQINIRNQPMLNTRKVIHGPHGKIIVALEKQGKLLGAMLEPIYLRLQESEQAWKVYQISGEGELQSIVEEKHSFVDIAADYAHVYGLFWENISIYQYSMSGWMCIRNVALRYDAESLCAHKQLITATTRYRQIIRYDLTMNQEQLVNRKASRFLSIDSIGHILIDYNCIKVLLCDNTTKEVDLGKIKWYDIRSIALDNQGRILVLLNDGTLWRLAPE